MRGLYKGKDIRWSLLSDPKERQGASRLQSQWITINDHPASRYILSVPNSSKYRLKVDESGFRHLTLAGDWVNNGLNSGCMEASVMSGMQASRHLTAFLKTSLGETDFDFAPKNFIVPILKGRLPSPFQGTIRPIAAIDYPTLKGCGYCEWQPTLRG